MKPLGVFVWILLGVYEAGAYVVSLKPHSRLRGTIEDDIGDPPIISKRDRMISGHAYSDYKFEYKRETVLEKTNYYFLKKEIKWRRKVEFKVTRKSGRNFTGKITVRHRGGGIKMPFQMIDWWFLGRGRLSAVLVEIVKRPYQPYPLGLVICLNSETSKFEYRYVVLGSGGVNIGDIITAGENAFFKEGNSKPLKTLPLNTNVYNLEVNPGQGSAIARSSKKFARILYKEGRHLMMQLPSGQNRLVFEECYATIGGEKAVINLPPLGKAGTARNLGRRPTVRGVAMNPVDHPHGGGTGKSGIGRKNALTPWGKYFRGKKKLTGTNKKPY